MKLSPFSRASFKFDDHDWFNYQRTFQIFPINFFDQSGYFSIECKSYRNGVRKDLCGRGKMLLDPDTLLTLMAPALLEKLKRANVRYTETLRESIAALKDGCKLRDSRELVVAEFLTRDADKSQPEVTRAEDLKVKYQLFVTKGRKFNVGQVEIEPTPWCDDPLNSPIHYPTYVYLRLKIAAIPEGETTERTRKSAVDPDSQLLPKARFGNTLDNWVNFMTNHAPGIYEDGKRRAAEYEKECELESKKKKNMPAERDESVNPPPPKKPTPFTQKGPLSLFSGQSSPSPRLSKSAGMFFPSRSESGAVDLSPTAGTAPSGVIIGKM